MTSTRVAVLGDIHANAPALRGALATADARGYDQLIFLGDLLTYGTDIGETLDLVGERVRGGRALVMKGNHDTVYLQPADTATYAARMPAWIRDSVDWTRKRLEPAALSELDFRDEHVLEGVLFSHANPFGPGQWTYLNSSDENRRAAEVLQARGMRAGVFGHTHRIKRFQLVRGEGAFLPATAGVLEADAVNVLNAGAIGQPRERSDLLPYVLWLTFPDPPHKVKFEFEPYSYDTSTYLAGVRASGMSNEAVTRICEFFAPQPERH